MKITGIWATIVSWQITTIKLLLLILKIVVDCPSSPCRLTCSPCSGIPNFSRILEFPPLLGPLLGVGLKIDSTNLNYVQTEIGINILSITIYNTKRSSPSYATISPAIFISWFFKFNCCTFQVYISSWWSLLCRWEQCHWWKW